MIRRHAPSGMVCAVDHLASGAGVAVMRAGGTAADAAVATSAVLAVTTQHMCGMGGDLLAVVIPPGGQPQALESAGVAGSGADPDRLRSEGHTTMPFRHDIRAVTVPGCVDGWLALHERHGARPLAEVLAPAIAYARDGFPVSPLLAASIPRVAHLADAADYLPDGSPAGVGTLVRRPGVARALEAMVADGRDGFYGGEFGAGLLEV
ncbi:MAG: gamma-glutamyltransferase, partial [Actinomycetes bacterium]